MQLSSVNFDLKYKRDYNRYKQNSMKELLPVRLKTAVDGVPMSAYFWIQVLRQISPDFTDEEVRNVINSVMKSYVPHADTPHTVKIATNLLQERVPNSNAGILSTMFTR